MSETEPWVGLSTDDFRNMLISLVGFRFGREPEKRLDEIRVERRRYMGKFLALVAVKPQHTVLELGSGCGYGTRALAERAQRVLACDISAAYLSVARQELVGVENVDFHLVQSHDLAPIADDSVDSVLAVSVFIHLNLYDIFLYFKEFNRILKQKGKVVFDFADAHRISGLWRRKSLEQQFREHVGYYRTNPGDLPALVQWNSARGITAVAGMAGFRRLKRRGNRLLFQRR